MQAEWSKPAAMFLTYKSIRTVAMRQWLMMEMNFIPEMTLSINNWNLICKIP